MDNGAFTFQEYHDSIKASILPQFPDYGDNMAYPAIGQAGETGEVVGKVLGLALLTLAVSTQSGHVSECVKKLWRDHGIVESHRLSDPHISEEALALRSKLCKEIGDALWYLDALAFTVNSSLEECARGNVEKLRGRELRGTSLGSGDDR